MTLYDRLAALHTIVVEGDALLSDAILQFFRSKGCPVTGVTTAEDALFAMRGRRFDVVISDQRLPTLDGVTFLMRARESQPATIRILLTDYPTSAIPDGDTRGDTSIDDVILKPFTVSELERSLRRVLESHDASGSRRGTNGPRAGSRR